MQQQAAELAMTHERALNELRQENERLKGNLNDARNAIVDLEQKVLANEQSNEFFARQLVNVKDSYEAKLLLRDETIASERASLVREKEVALLQQQSRFDSETGAWKQEIDSLRFACRALRELQAQNAQYHSDLDEQTYESGKLRLHCEQVQLQCEDLEARHSRERGSWQESLMMSEQSRLESQQSVQCYEQSCERLQQELNTLRLEQEDRLAMAVKQHAATVDRAHMEKFVSDIRACHMHLRLIADDTRHILLREKQKTEGMLRDVQCQAQEMVIQQNEKDMVIATKQSRIIQLETQLKNERRAVRHLETEIASTTKRFESRDATLRAKHIEQKDHLAITVAVRDGLMNELQVKKQRIEEQDKQLASAALMKKHAQTKVQQLQQQIKVLQHTYVQELEKYAAEGARKSRRASIDDNVRALKHVVVLMACLSVRALFRMALESEKREVSLVTCGYGRLSADEFSGIVLEWSEFLELVAAFEQESHRAQVIRPLQ